MNYSLEVGWVVNGRVKSQRHGADAKRPRGDVGEDDFLEGGTRGLQQNQSRSEVRSSVGDEERQGTSLAMAKNNGRLTDLVEELCACSLDAGFLQRSVGDEAYAGGEEGVKGRVAHGAVSGPLGVQVREGPEVVFLGGREALLELFGRVATGEKLGVWAGEVRGAGAEGLVDDVDLVAAGEEIGGPAGAVVWCVEEVLSLVNRDSSSNL